MNNLVIVSIFGILNCACYVDAHPMVDLDKHFVIVLRFASTYGYSKNSNS
jgi:hypothetical protein